jgi:hypothetical protein
MKMEPFDRDELSDSELDNLLKKWEVPPAPARLRAAIFPEEPKPKWQRLWSASFRVPLPVAAALAIALALAAWQARRPGAPPEVVRTERVEVPVLQERVVTRTVYRYRVAPSAQMLKPVAELRPRIIRTPDEE